MRAIENKLVYFLSEDIGKLILRITLGALMILHGYKKAMHGISGIKTLVVNAGFPEFLAYGVYLGEIIIPIMIILGLYTRISGIIYAITMAFAIYLIHSSHLFALSAKTGGLVIELPLLYMMAALALAFIGAGKYSFDRR